MVCGSATADSGKIRHANQNNQWQSAPRIPAPKAVGCNRLQPAFCFEKVALLVENYPSPRSSPIPVKIIPIPLVADTTAPTLVVSAGSGTLHTPVASVMFVIVISVP